MTQHGEFTPADQLVAALGDTLDYSRASTSFSPHYSDLGLRFTDDAGIPGLFLHYNRRTVTLGAPFLALPGTPVRQERTALAVTQHFDGGTAQYAFCARNTWLVETRGLGAVAFQFNNDGQASEVRQTAADGGAVIFDAYLPTGDPRDPDKWFPFVLGVRVLCGTCAVEATGLTLTPDAGGRLVVCFSANMLGVDHAQIAARLAEAPASCAEAAARSRAWLTQALGSLTVTSNDPEEAVTLAKAAYTLLFNACAAPGKLAGRIAAFPSRGGYPTHYLWDSCFQNLALEYMEPRLAPDALLLLAENLREDGKMAHFLCSTWMRPHESQPPLVGWAALRLVRQRNDLAFARQILPALVKNTNWWLTQRMTHYGLITCPDPLETGWDDTPRLDHGPVLALDMNSHLLLQMRAAAELARMTGDTATAEAMQARADAFAARMVEVLYDPQANLFRDVLVATGEQLSIKTPACFLPLLAGVPIAEDNARAMIETYLLDPQYFFGAVPFPCVAYDEETYRPEKWWRGPVWMPIAYLMLKVLEQYGYTAECRKAADRLYGVMVRDGDLHELFNSQTGEGMGQRQQGWSAAICLRLKMERG